MSRELADFNPATSHLHTCEKNEGSDFGCTHGCIHELFTVAQDLERALSEKVVVSGNHEFVSMSSHSVQCGCGETVTAELGKSKLRAWTEHVRTAVFESREADKPTYPDCEGHNELQKRDGKEPWCSRCGWTRGQPVRPARKVGLSSAERIDKGSWG